MTGAAIITRSIRDTNDREPGLEVIRELVTVEITLPTPLPLGSHTITGARVHHGFTDTGQWAARFRSQLIDATGDTEEVAASVTASSIVLPDAVVFSPFPANARQWTWTDNDAAQCSGALPMLAVVLDTHYRGVLAAEARRTAASSDRGALTATMVDPDAMSFRDLGQLLSFGATGPVRFTITDEGDTTPA